MYGPITIRSKVGRRALWLCRVREAPMPSADEWRSFARSVRADAEYVPGVLARDGAPTPFGAMFALFCDANATIVELRESLDHARRPVPTQPARPDASEVC